MIYKDGKLILSVYKNIANKVEKNIGAIYKGTLLVWLTVYDAIRSCFGSGTWLPDRPWLKDDTWKNN